MISALTLAARDALLALIAILIFAAVSFAIAHFTDHDAENVRRDWIQLCLEKHPLDWCEKHWEKMQLPKGEPVR